MRVSEESVDICLKSIEDERGDDFRQLDDLIGEVFFGESRVLWVGKFWGGTDQTIIGYGDLVQSRSKGEDIHWFVIGLALQKANISIYVNATRDGKYLGQAYGKSLGKQMAEKYPLPWRFVGTEENMWVYRLVPTHVRAFHRMNPLASARFDFREGSLYKSSEN